MNAGLPKIQLAHDLKGFFEEQISTAAKKQGQTLTPFTTAYLAKLLTRFSNSENLFVTGENKKKAHPVLSLLWLESLSQPLEEQYQQLQFLGDVALFTSGFFRERIDRTLVDMDFYIAMGERAYERVGKIRESIAAERALNVFFELAESFTGFVEIFAELSDQSLLGNDQDILKLYEKWLKTGSHRISRMLGEAGIIAGTSNSQGDT